MSNLRYRLLIIGALVAASIWALFPREVEVRERRVDGTYYDTTIQRVPLKKGLDLSGGMHLALEVDDSKRAVDDKADAIDRALKVVRTRIEGFGVNEPVIAKSGENRIMVELPGIDDRERAIKIVQDQAFLEFKITDETQALERVLPRLDAVVRERGLAGSAAPATAAPAPQPAKSGIEGLLTAGDTAAKVAGADSARADSTKADSAVVATTGGPFSSLVMVPPAGQAMPGQYFVTRANESKLQRLLADSAVLAAMPPGKELLFGNDTLSMGGEVVRPLYMVNLRPIITGEYLTDAKPNQDPMEGTIVQFSLNNEGGRRFQSETGRHINDYMAIVLDKRVMGQPPVIRSAIGRNGQITMGGKDLQAAQDLALVLRAGALPVPLRVVEVRTIGPSLGEDAIRDGIRAGLLGLALVIVIMVAYYRFSGLLAVAGLAFYALTTLGFLAAVGATLTLPGIAGFILSIGMAVDANFLQFERIREEIIAGKTTRTAIDEGFRNSWSAIVDTHVTTALTAAVLYQYGTGPVQGFAVTLIVGVASSMLSSVFVVRTLFLLWLNRSRGAQPLSI